jgi:hypothetical protein
VRYADLFGLFLGDREANVVRKSAFRVTAPASLRVVVL